MNLEQQKKQARELLRAIRSDDPSAIARLRSGHTRWAAVEAPVVRQSVALHDTQFVLAREQVSPVGPSRKRTPSVPPGKNHTRLFVADLSWLNDRVQGLLRTRHSAGPAALEQIREWHPRFADPSDDEICRAAFTEEDARLVYAREHGFDTWQELAARVNQLASRSDTPASEPFLAAFQALKSGNFSTFEALLNANPWLARARGTNG